MRRVVLFFGIFSLLVAVAKSAQDEMDIDLMQTIEDTNKSLASNIAIKDAKSSAADAKELEALFEKVEVFFVNKGDAPDAVDLSKKIKDLSGDIVTFVAVNDFASAAETATTLSRTCKTCHNFYKME